MKLLLGTNESNSSSYDYCHKTNLTIWLIENIEGFSTRTVRAFHKRKDTNSRHPATASNVSIYQLLHKKEPSLVYGHACVKMTDFIKYTRLYSLWCRQMTNISVSLHYLTSLVDLVPTELEERYSDQMVIG